MRFVIVLTLMLIAMRVTQYGASSGLVAAADASAIGSTLVGLVMLSPLVGLFFLFRRFFSWHRELHRRMSSEGAWRSGNRP